LTEITNDWTLVTKYFVAVTGVEVVEAMCDGRPFSISEDSALGISIQI